MLINFMICFEFSEYIYIKVFLKNMDVLNMDDRIFFCFFLLNIYMNINIYIFMNKFLILNWILKIILNIKL